MVFLLSSFPISSHFRLRRFPEPTMICMFDNPQNLSSKIGFHLNCVDIFAPTKPFGEEFGREALCCLMSHILMFVLNLVSVRSI